MSSTSTMRAAVITSPGGPEVLALAERPAPTPGAWDLLIEVAASSLNRADLLQRKGVYPAPHGAPPDIPGLELAGVVRAIGARVTRFRPGDRVMAIVGGGANAELAVVHEREAIRVPDSLALTDAAAIPEVFMTAFDAAFLQGGLGAGEWLACNAVGSGVGTALIQLARAFGAFSLGVARTPDKVERALGLGLDRGAVGSATELVQAARDAGLEARVLVDLVGGPDLSKALGVLAPRGRAILVGLVAGAKAELPLGLLLSRRLTLTGTVLRSRPIEEKIALARSFEDRVVPLFERGRLRPVIDRVMPLAQIADAHRLLESNATFGKIVLDHG